MSKRTSTDLYLSADQQDLLVAALDSKPPTASYTPTTHTLPGSGHLSLDDDSPYLDFDNDGEFDDTFDVGPQARMIGDLPGEQLLTNDELHDKRKSIDGKDDEDGGGGKRRGGEDKTGKKPGRKPLTSEPTSKRKAQNRAAQRAFRERKERHLRDLETKVEDLEKVSEATSHENGLLRAHVERLQVELKEYRKRLSWMSSGGTSRSNSLNLGSHSRAGSFNQQNVNQTRTSSVTNGNGRAVRAPGAGNTSRSNSQAQIQAQSSLSQSPLSTNEFTASPRPAGQSGSVDSLSNLFSPSILESARHSSFNSYFSQNHTSAQNAAVSNSSLSNTNSPTSSSESHHTASSIGTSPEPSLSSPANKLLDGGTALMTINETQTESSVFGKDELCKQLSRSCGCSDDPIPPILNMGLKTSNELSLGFGTMANATADFNASGFDPNAFNLIASQPNHVEFDPVLFGDYRESQDNILSQDFGSFFNDAYPLPDLGSPTHNFNDVSADQLVSAQAARAVLLKQVEAANEGNEEVVPDNERPMSCNKIWDRLQSMEKFRNGEIDIDNLCSELRAKAKCSEAGAVVDKKDVDKILGQTK
ncbi:hypothetical protein DV736_g1202, partial [Chaetothyriales sp. CBS 134916]